MSFIPSNIDEDLEFPDETFGNAVASRFVDSRYFAQRDGAPGLNEWMADLFDQMSIEAWDRAWELLQKESAGLCRSSPIASPFNVVIGNRINFAFAELLTLANLVNNNLIDEVSQPRYLRELIDALKFASSLDYAAYVRWGVVSRERYENLHDVALLLVSMAGGSLKIMIKQQPEIMAFAKKLKKVMEQVLAMEELKAKV